MNVRPGSKIRAAVHAFTRGEVRSRTDDLATEEPLEIRLTAGGARKTIAVTMRTPGHDFELAAGFLFGEQVVRSRDDIRRITYCVDPAVDAGQQYNIVSVDLAGSGLPDLSGLDRHVFTSSACGVCGKASLEALRMRGCAAPPAGPAIAPEVVERLPEALRGAQGVFETTGGLHAAALFDADGAIITAREDVGRHNAMDKLIGWALLEGRLPLHDRIVMVSGRASYELLQKAVTAGAPVFCAVSAPSSLSVQVAREFGVTLIGFLRGDRFNVYSGLERIHDRHAEGARACP
jgi:FdhD protein